MSLNPPPPPPPAPHAAVPPPPPTTRTLTVVVSGCVVTFPVDVLLVICAACIHTEADIPTNPPFVLAI
jgi:hypothetical protein